MFIWIEWLALLTGVISAVLTVKEKVSCWWTGIISLLLYVYILGSNRVYGDVVIQIIFIIQSLYGWLIWKQAEKNKQMPVSYINSQDTGIIKGICFSVFVTGIVAEMFAKFNLSGEPKFDALIVSASLLANTLCIGWCRICR